MFPADEAMKDLYNITLENAFDIIEKTLYDYKDKY